MNTRPDMKPLEAPQINIFNIPYIQFQSKLLKRIIGKLYGSFTRQKHRSIQSQEELSSFQNNTGEPK